jgi:ATP synthase protein I
MNHGDGFRQGMSFAFRLGTELTVATFIGALMGYTLDYFLSTKPWFMVLGLLLGGAAGCLNVYRAAQEMTLNNNDKDDNGSDHKNGSA